MRLGGQIISHWCDVNDFDYSQTFEYNQGSNATVHLQLIDLDKKICDCSKGSFYLRYIPEPGASLQIQVHNIDDNQVIDLAGTQDPTDPSVWSFDLLPSYQIGSGNIHLALTEGSTVSKGVIKEGIHTNPTDPGSLSFC